LDSSTVDVADDRCKLNENNTIKPPISTDARHVATSIRSGNCCDIRQLIHPIQPHKTMIVDHRRPAALPRTCPAACASEPSLRACNIDASLVIQTCSPHDFYILRRGCLQLLCGSVAFGSNKCATACDHVFADHDPACAECENVARTEMLQCVCRGTCCQRFCQPQAARGSVEVSAGVSPSDRTSARQRVIMFSLIMI